MRAADNWESPRFSNIFLTLGFFCSQAESRPAQLQLTQAVGPHAFFESVSRANRLVGNVMYRQPRKFSTLARDQSGCWFGLSNLCFGLQWSFARKGLYNVSKRFGGADLLALFPPRSDAFFLSRAWSR
jgi:hypothetical protein